MTRTALEWDIYRSRTVPLRPGGRFLFRWDGHRRTTRRLSDVAGRERRVLWKQVTSRLTDIRGRTEVSAYPNLLRRYLGAVIDGVVIILLVVLVGQLPLYSSGNQNMGALIFILVLANYEPILTAFACTAGQATMRFGVRDVRTGARFSPCLLAEIVARSMILRPVRSLSRRRPPNDHAL
jgi:hypothetical protein